MNKKELVEAIAFRANTTKKQADAVLSAAIEEIQGAVASGDKVTLVGFGVFEPKQRKGRTGRNPKTGEPVEIASNRVPAFSAGRNFKEMVSL